MHLLQSWCLIFRIRTRTRPKLSHIPLLATPLQHKYNKIAYQQQLCNTESLASSRLYHAHTKTTNALIIYYINDELH